MSNSEEPIVAFVRERMEPFVGGRVTPAQLHAAYLSWRRKHRDEFGPSYDITKVRTGYQFRAYYAAVERTKDGVYKDVRILDE